MRPIFAIKPGVMPLTLEDSDFRHCVQVLRKTVGEVIGVIDGDGNYYDVRITALTPKKATLVILNHYPNFGESRTRVALALGLIKHPDRLEWLFEKSIELGLTDFYPLCTQHTEKINVPVERLKRVGMAALKQCGRCKLPDIHPVMPINDWLNSVAGMFETKLIAHKTGTLPIAEAIALPRTDTVIIIGPEGDFSEPELTLAQKAGFIKVSLGQRRLRSETAALAALAHTL